jgi:hypothetical protein
MNRIDRMIEIATQDGVDVLRYGIPHDIFISEWQNEYGIDLPVVFIEEIEREFPKGLVPSIAAQYWIQLDEWFMDNNYI